MGRKRFFPTNPNSSFTARAEHVAQKLAMLTIGRAYVSNTAQRMRRRIANVTPFSEVPQLRTAVVAHVFYPDLIDEIAACRDQIPLAADLILTTPPHLMAQLTAATDALSNCTVVPVENRGRDIAPFLHVLNSGLLDVYDVVLKLHTKRSTHLRDGDIRRRLLYAKLCGESHSIARTLQQFGDPATGMIGWAGCFRSRPEYLMGNRANLVELSQRMGMDPPIPLGFFEGTMFWVRPSALQPLRDLHLLTDDFPDENKQVDGTLAHAVERAFSLSVWKSGKVIRGLDGKALTSRTLV